MPKAKLSFNIGEHGASFYYDNKLIAQNIRPGQTFYYIKDKLIGKPYVLFVTYRFDGKIRLACTKLKDGGMFEWQTTMD